MLYDMRIFDEPILVKVLTLCPETLVAVERERERERVILLFENNHRKAA